MLIKLRECSKCGESKPKSEFWYRSKIKGILQNECKTCLRKRREGYYEKNKDKWIKHYPRNRERKRELRAERRLITLSHYGGDPPVCACCGESIYKFLTIDHINNDGNKHRKEIGIGRLSGMFLYTWLIKNSFPEGFQVLCWNCTRGKRMNNGVCLHKRNT